MPITLGFDDYTLAQALMYAANNGATVINNSWGLRTNYSPLIEETIKTLYDMGVVMIFSAGNNSEDIKLQLPGSMSEVIVVGTSTPNDTAAVFSNIGMMDITALGAGIDNSNLPPNGVAVIEPVNNILSLLAAGSFLDEIPFFPIPKNLVGDGYVRLAGTSMSAPYVSGIVALIKSRNPNYTIEQVRQLLHLGADDIATVGYDNTTGFGRANAYQSLQQTVPLEVLLRIPRKPITTLELDIIATVKGSALQTWVLEYGLGANPSIWVKISSGTQQFDNSLLVNWDASILQENDNVIRLSALAQDGKYYVDYQPITVNRVHISSPSYTTYILNGRKMGVAGRDIKRTSEILDIIGTVNPGGLKNYSFKVERVIDNEVSSKIENRIAVEDVNFIIPKNASKRTLNGLIARWDTSNITQAGSYRIIMTVNASTGIESTDTYVILDPWLKSGYPIENDWFFDSTGIQTIDLNHDGHSELIVGIESEVHFYDSNGNDITGWPQSVSPDPGEKLFIDNSPIVVDLDRDGEYEVIAMNDHGKIFMWSEDGNLKNNWPTELPDKATGEITIADINNDKIKDIIIVSHGNIYVLDSQARSLPGFPVNISTQNKYAHAVTGDMNGDSLLEIAVYYSKNSEHLLHVYQSDGQIFKNWPISFGEKTNFTSEYNASSPLFADLNKDGKNELIYGDTAAKVHAFTEDGTELAGWPFVLQDESQFSYSSIADFDQDGYLDIIISTNSMAITTNLYEIDLRTFFQKKYQIYVINRHGELLPGWPMIRIENALIQSGTGYGEPMIADINNDDELELNNCSESQST